MTPLHGLVLVAAGIVAGWVNTIAGGGSLVAVPALMWLGLPADVANGTSRIAIVSQGVTAVTSYRRAGRLDGGLFWPLAAPSVVGALLGAWVATLLPAAVFKPILLGTLALMGLSMFVNPSALGPRADETMLSLSGNRRAQLALLATGFYGGLLQAGVGIVLLFVLSGLLRIDLVRANALKVAIVFAYTIAVVAIFAASAKVAWLDGAVLAVGQALGARLGVHFSLRGSERAVKRALFVIIVGLCVALLLRP
jgi:uncharacterized protein